MRNLILLALFLAYVGVSLSQTTCTATQFLLDGKCVECNDATSGFPNCKTCTYDATANKPICSACLDNFFFNSKAKSTCAKCDTSCNGGNCLDSDADPAAPATKTDCKSCLAKFFLNSNNVCAPCADKNCNECGTPSAEDANCKKCADTFFIGDSADSPAVKNSCLACNTGCKTCSSKTTCTACVAAAEFVSRPADDGICVKDCAAPKGQGVLDGGALVCSAYPTPAFAANIPENVTLNASHNSLVNVTALCAPASTDAATKKLELVGAIAVIQPAAATDIDVLAIRKAILDGSKATPADFAAQDTAFNNLAAGKASWINIVGTDTGTAELKQLKAPKGGNSVLSYVCVNTNNVKSAVKTIKIINQVYNPSFRFSLAVNRTLLADELTNLTCAVSKAIFPSDATAQGAVKNNKGGVCAVPKRILQAAAGNYTDVTFDVASNQYDDSLEATVKGKLADVKANATTYLTSVKASLIGDVQLDYVPNDASAAVPKVVINQVSKTASNITLNFTSDIPATVYYALVASGASGVDDSVVRGSSDSVKTFAREKLSLNGGDVLNKTLLSLNASSNYDLYYFAANKYDVTKNGGLLNKPYSTASSSFSGLLSICSIVLLVLALFI